MSHRIPSLRNGGEAMSHLRVVGGLDYMQKGDEIGWKAVGVSMANTTPLARPRAASRPRAWPMLLVWIGVTILCLLTWGSVAVSLVEAAFGVG